METFLKVKDQPNYFRDPHSKAIIVMDQNGLKAYNNQKAIAQKVHNETDTIKAEIESLKDDIAVIKSMMSALVENLNHK